MQMMWRLIQVVALLSIRVSCQASYYIDPASVPSSLRGSWCSTQTTSCPLLCLQLPGQSSTTLSNTCDPKSLTFNCVCESGQSPNSSEYSQTLPFFMCQEFGNQCVAGCGGNPECQSKCRENHPCGAQNPTRVNTTSTAIEPSKTDTSTSGVAFTGLGGSSATDSSDSSKSGSLAALDLGRSYGLAIVFAGVFAGFAVMM
ncbi:unnamed protein product [Blumeria hordei]|uniref:DUF7707 domain-containing protein n=2 Tax=Blumeria hordei TaxID=2867405 RepID=A0A383UQF4_BLUHO|nr:hypothetical protein BGHDH14_bgh00979 [Blumeria hordei DH14]SZF01999.1 unnamed protein product [Blumeria hordei]